MRSCAVDVTHLLDATMEVPRHLGITDGVCKCRTVRCGLLFRPFLTGCRLGLCDSINAHIHQRVVQMLFGDQSPKVG